MNRVGAAAPEDSFLLSPSAARRLSMSLSSVDLPVPHPPEMPTDSGSSLGSASIPATTSATSP